MVGTQTEQTHTQLTKTRAANIPNGPCWHLMASGGLWRWLRWLGKWGLLELRGRRKNGARTQLQWKQTHSESSELHKEDARPAGYMAFLHFRCCPAAGRALTGDPTHPRGPLCVTHPTVTICLLFVPPFPLFNCWMSLQSCVPKTIHSREQSYTKKGVAPEGDNIHGNHHLFTAA